MDNVVSARIGILYSINYIYIQKTENDNHILIGIVF